jgi:K+-sensing histidine kinase KdpD
MTASSSETDETLPCALDSLYYRPHTDRMIKIPTSALRVSVGACLCASASGVVTALSRRNSLKALIPLMFLSLIALIALKFGPLAATVGTLISAATFAMYLFKPFHSLRVDDPIARGNLIWMVLLGLIAAHFLPPPPDESSDESLSV